MADHMVALAQVTGVQVETVVEFRDLIAGDEFSLRPDLEVWLTAWGKPHVYDPKRDRWVVATREHGLAYAHGDTRVMLRRTT